RLLLPFPTRRSSDLGNIAESASIDSELLMVTEDGGEQIYDLPDGEFFVSVAPFITYTHPCSVHSLTGCQGELVNADMDVQITDEDRKSTRLNSSHVS